METTTSSTTKTLSASEKRRLLTIRGELKEAMLERMKQIISIDEQLGVEPDMEDEYNLWSIQSSITNL